MADLDEIEKEKLRAEAAQRLQNLQAEAAQRLSGAPPIPATITAASRASEYAQRGLPTGDTVQGDQPAVDRDNPQTGLYTNQTGENLGRVQPGQQSPAGSTGIQGQQSPDEAAFWQANPNGAVKDPQTGMLIGLGNVAPTPPPVDANGMVSVNSGLGPPAVAYNDQTRINTGLGPPAGRFSIQQEIPDFVHIPEIDPGVVAQRRSIQNELAATMRDLNTASSVRPRGGISQREVLNQKLQQLTQANNALGQEHYRQSEARARAAMKNSDLQDKYRTNQDVIGATKALGGIQAAPGTPEHKAALAQIALNYPNAMRDKTFESKVIAASQFHDAREATRQRATEAGLIPVTTGYGQKGESVKFMTPAQHSEQQLEGINKELATRGLPLKATDIFNPIGAGHQSNKPYDQLGPNDIVSVPYTKKNGDEGTHKIKKATLESLKAQYNDRYKAAGGEFPTAAAPAAAPAGVGALPATPRVRKYNPETGQLE